MAIISFNDYEIPSNELDAIKSALVRSKIRDYVKTHNGTAPDDSIIAGFYNIPDDIMSVYKCTSYARYREEQYESSNAGGGSANARKYAVGDIICWSNGTLVPVKPDAFSASSGTPIGIVAIPDNFLQDKKARIISCMGVNKDGTASTTENSMAWFSGYSSLLTAVFEHQYTEVACVGHDDNGNWEPDNSIEHTDMDGRMPILNTSGDPTVIYSPTDPVTYWTRNDSNCHIASPFDGENLNPSYCASEYTNAEGEVVSINNALSDFDGLNNTLTIVEKGSTYAAAWACNHFSTDGIAAGKWYLPAAGELGFMLARFDTLQASLNKIKSVSSESAATLYSAEATSSSHWSSTECGNYGGTKYTYSLHTSTGIVQYSHKCETSHHVRPWAQIS